MPTETSVRILMRLSKSFIISCSIIEVWRQDQQRNFDIVLGDYIYEPDLGYWWKILAVSQNEVMPNCYYLIIRGQRLTSREEYKLRVRDALTADESHTGR